MSKFSGKIGYAASYEKRPGVWVDGIIERLHYGDIIRNTNRWSETTDQTNDELAISNQLSIVADPYAAHNFHRMKYVEFMGALWKVTNAEVVYPRLLITLGGVYNGPTPEAPSTTGGNIRE